MSEVLEANEQLMEFMKAQVREQKTVLGSTAPSKQNAALFKLMFLQC